MRSNLPFLSGLPIVLLIFSSTQICTAAALSSTIMDRDPSESVRVLDPVLRLALTEAIRGADARLQKPACRQVFADFADASGRSLADVMKERGLTPRERLRSIYFYDGAQHRLCRRGRTAAVARPGSPVIFVCRRFGEYAQDRVLGRVLVIHELLHTLGLGENPPTSLEITRQVRARCTR